MHNFWIELNYWRGELKYCEWCGRVFIRLVGSEHRECPEHRKQEQQACLISRGSK
jgi:hypothetical protein